MTRRRLLLAGGTVVIAVHGLHRRRKRPSRGLLPSPRSHATAVVPLLLPQITLGLFGFDVGGWVGGLIGFGVDVAANIKDFVYSVVASAIETVLNIVGGIKEVLDIAIHAIKGTTEWLVDHATNAAQAVATVVADTYEMLDGAFANFRDMAKGMLEGAWDNLKDWVLEMLPDWIEGALGEAWAFLKALVAIGFDGISFLINLIDDPIGFLWNLLRDVVQDAIDVALGGITDLFAVLLQIWHILEWLASHADEITTEVLETLWGILKWVITHIDDFTIDVFNDVLNMTPERFAEKMIEAMDANRSGIEEKFASWLR